MKILMKLVLAVFGIIAVLAALAIPVGWAINLYEVATFGGGITETTEGILMIVGIILAPLGAVMGLFV